MHGKSDFAWRLSVTSAKPMLLLLGVTFDLRFCSFFLCFVDLRLYKCPDGWGTWSMALGRWSTRSLWQEKSWCVSFGVSKMKVWFFMIFPMSQRNPTNFSLNLLNLLIIIVLKTYYIKHLPLFFLIKAFLPLLPRTTLRTPWQIWCSPVEWEPSSRIACWPRGRKTSWSSLEKV